MCTRIIFFAMVMSVFASTAGRAAEELNCLSDEERGAAKLYLRLQSEAYSKLDRRLDAIAELKTPEQIHAYQLRMREAFVKQLGGLPQRTPLNSRTVGVIESDGYRIEKVIFESQPNHHITANLYLPDGEGPFPGIGVSSGHSRTAKTADYNQRFGIAMAMAGMAALCFDPIGQGERSQILTGDGQPRFSGTTTEHFLVGVGSILVGRNTARYRVWDAIRAIDYLVSRPEIDPQRIGFTGCSGGGTLTSYIMAIDDRVACAAPACYLTTFRRLIETIGPQDAEQNIFAQLAIGLDQPDYVLLRAPRPTLISSTTADFFDIDGSWENFRQAKQIYGRLGFPERVDLVEIEGKHGVQPQNLATITHWMSRWLLRRDQPVPVADFKTREPKELLCTESGQVLSMPDERSVFDLNKVHAVHLTAKRKKLWASHSREQIVDKIEAVAGIRPLSDFTPPKWAEAGRVNRADYHIDKLVLRTDSTVPLPALTFHPREPADAAYLYLHDDGKIGDSAAGGKIEKLVNEGYAVVSVDLRGQGETASGRRDKLLGDWKTYYLSYLLGHSLVGGRTEDALAAAHFVAYYQKDGGKPRDVHLVGTGKAGIVALHAAALHPELFASVTLHDTPRDWTSIVSQQAPNNQLESTVHGALEVYDLPDLVRLYGEGKIRFE